VGEVDHMPLPRVAVVSDFLEEQWLSMDLVAEMLVEQLRVEYAASFEVTQLRPRMASRARRLPLVGLGRVPFQIDRYLGRYWDYPRWLGRRRQTFDVFHIIDHSYAQLVHRVPSDRCVVTCHDLDTFRCVLEPGSERRSPVFRRLIRNVLSGLQAAARITCDSETIRKEILLQGWCAPERVIVVPNGVDSVCCPEPDPRSDDVASRLLGPKDPSTTEILHVGSTAARKRIDVLLNVFAGVLRKYPQARLVRAGGPFTAGQESLAARLGLDEAVVGLPHLSRGVLAAVYRRAALVVQPSEREGFGLPVLEAMACGTPVLASDLPVLREVGGNAVRYCPVADIRAWQTAIVELLLERDQQPEAWLRRRERGLTQAGKFSWTEYTKKMVQTYQELLGATGPHA
jgi:glycosyltransferase involved in cell wall biosynthesis